MKKILILSCLFLFGCDGIGVFSHTHENACIRRYSNDFESNYKCYPDWTEKECLWKEHINADNDNSTYSSLSSISCEDFCEQESKWECTIITGSPD